MSSFPFVGSFRPGRVPKAVVAACALVALAAVGVFYVTRRTPSAPRPKVVPQGTITAIEALPGYDPKLTEPEKDLLRTGPDSKDKESVKHYLLAKAKLEPDALARRQLEQEAIILTDGYGKTPAVTADNAQVRSTLAALAAPRSHPERLNPRMAPAAFDAAAYAAKPQEYLDVAEPGRVFQTKPAGPGVTAIAPVSPYWQDVKQGDSIELAVKAVPGAPVTFTSFDAGAFGNGLTTQTVRADGAGLATVRFLGVPGTVNESNILAASPLTSGQVRFKASTLVYADGRQVATSATR